MHGISTQQTEEGVGSVRKEFVSQNTGERKGILHDEEGSIGARKTWHFDALFEGCKTPFGPIASYQLQ
jgi:hypothetical protein